MAGIAAAAAVLLVTGPHGPGLTSDSAAYVSAAEHLADGEGLAAYGGEAFVLWPTGFPLLLAALAELFGVSAVTAGRVANAVILGFITGAAWLVTRRTVTVGSRPPRYLVGCVSRARLTGRTAACI